VRHSDNSAGFVWRLQGEDGNATSIRAYDDEQILFSMSVWESMESLYHYVYRSDHAGPLRDRGKWFEPMEGPVLVLWWIPAGHLPSTEEAKARFDFYAGMDPPQKLSHSKCPFPVPEAMCRYSLWAVGRLYCGYS
jgi:hypothetical protein